MSSPLAGCQTTEDIYDRRVFRDYTRYLFARRSADGSRFFRLLVHVILQGSNYKQRRAACTCLYNLEKVFLPKYPKMLTFSADEDINIRHLLDPQTVAEFYATMEPKTWLEKILDGIQEMDICRPVLFLASKVIYRIRENNDLKWIFQPELSALFASLAGKNTPLELGLGYY
jgi:hypothetical protein